MAKIENVATLAQFGQQASGRIGFEGSEVRSAAGAAMVCKAGCIARAVAADNDATINDASRHSRIFIANPAGYRRNDILCDATMKASHRKTAEEDAIDE